LHPTQTADNTDHGATNDHAVDPPGLTYYRTDDLVGIRPIR
jgi:hypothetical protein